MTLLPGFPDRYQASILNAMDLCAVKHTIKMPLRFENHLVQGDTEPG
ncbi:hypothetical protein [uncultured Thiocystis sp.]|jgi:ribosomal protein S12 methylthiotransferase accessory factor|nr:hypothetical protein [uncultured Thiocystis sp.]